MSEHKEEIILAGQEAIDLWLKGKEAWNQWVDNNRDAQVNFEGVNFGELKQRNNKKVVSFKDYHFPNGEIDFSNTRFGEGDVNFANARFGKGDVSFLSARLGEGDVSFSHARFGEGDVNFNDARFGEGDVNFANARFGKGYVSFASARFGEGDVNFYDARFGEGYVSFHDAQFGKGDVSFFNARFEGDVIFANARFGEGDVLFSHARFGEGDVNFYHITTGVGRFDFRVENLRSCETLTMSNSTIDSALNISGIDSPVVLNLRHTKLAFPIDIDNVNINYRWRSHYFVFRRALNSSDSTSFRRLKKLANDAADHERALDFYAKEMRTGYWHFITGPKLALYYLYDWSSDYGRSIVRPFIGLIVIACVYAEIYLTVALKSEDTSWNAIKFSVGHIFSIYPGVRETRKSVIKVLFGEDFACAPWWLPAVTTSQYIVSTALLFLLGLALRNRFRS